MKPKIALAKYLDWAVLAVLAAALIAVAVWSFVYKAHGEGKLLDEMNDYDRKVQTGMNDTSAVPAPPHDYLADLRERLEHPAVLDPYRHNPFVTREDIPFPPLQLKVTTPPKPRVLKFKGTRFTQVVSPEQDIVKVTLEYDLLTGVSTVTFLPLKEGVTIIRIQTDEDLVHLFKISATTGPVVWAPNPPVNVVVVPRAPVEILMVLQPPMVRISFMANDPKDMAAHVGLTTSAAIYRKPAGASDAEYVRLDDPRQPLTPLSHDQIHKLSVEFLGSEATPIQPAPGEAPVPPAAGPPVPEAVPEIRPLTAAERTGEPPAGSFVFLDPNVDGGESYVYKVVTLSTASDAEPVPCDDPFITQPVTVPALVEFTVRSIAGDRATVHVTRRDPATGAWLERDFTVGIGMKIGEKVTVKLPSTTAGRPPQTEVVDFSTGCLLVNVLPTFEVVGYSKLRVDHSYTTIYQAKGQRDPQILYLTPRGALHLKNKEKPSAPAAAPAASPAP